MSITTTKLVVKQNFNIKFSKKEGAFMANMEIRTALKEKRMYNYELAEMLGITEWTLSRKLRKELPDDEKKKILDIIEKAR